MSHSLQSPCHSSSAAPGFLQAPEAKGIGPQPRAGAIWKSRFPELIFQQLLQSASSIFLEISARGIALRTYHRMTVMRTPGTGSIA